MLRVPDGGRVENRACDGAANPYLAMAVQLAAGLDGIDRGLDPGEPNRDNLHALAPEAVAARGIRALPPTLLHAADELVTDDVLREALGKTPDGDYIDYYAQVKRDEFRAWHSGGERLGSRALPDALLSACRRSSRPDLRRGHGLGRWLPSREGLVKGTNWWGAFVIGLAGTILVTGIAPYVVQGTGALGIILIGVMTIAGCFLCLCLAELATMWPDRTGGIPVVRDRVVPAAGRRQGGAAHRRDLGLGLLAGLVPGRADQRDPDRVLPGGAVQLQPRPPDRPGRHHLGHPDRRHDHAHLLRAAGG